MKFECGNGRPNYRKAQQRKLSAAKKAKTWQPFFCLIPRKVAANDCRWLETIQRKKHQVKEFDACDSWIAWKWKYRAMKP